MSDLSAVGGPAGSASAVEKNKDEYRLPTDVYPKVRYVTTAHLLISSTML
jgi:hypothetical protein